ncbi:1-hydroxy-2-methyl-2-butenyl 4-diphosphate reductase [Peterkaempfera sp. SMS 1(5)a]|uniref:phosphorylase family protein n=1 Tax=Peterkaempfera podocarpi TaxID=3232308 RepID=UPI003672A6A6
MTSTAPSAPAAGPSARPGPPLLVACALGVERWALRGGDWSGGRAVLTATGMGPLRARKTVSALLGDGGSAYGGLLAVGFCAAAGRGIRPGDAVVATGVRDEGECSIEIPSSGLLARLLRDQGMTVHTGLLHSADQVVRGAEARARLHTAGVTGIDMETAAVLSAARRGAPRLPFAAVRIVVDTPERELLRPGTVPGGVRAWRALRSTVPALTAWHRTLAGRPDTADQGARPHRNSAMPSDTPTRTLPQEAS